MNSCLFQDDYSYLKKEREDKSNRFCGECDLWFDTTELLVDHVISSHPMKPDLLPPIIRKRGPLPWSRYDHVKGTLHFSGQTGGGDLLRGGWTVLDVLPVLGVFGGAESKKRRKNWIRPPQGADLGGQGGRVKIDLII